MFNSSSPLLIPRQDLQGVVSDFMPGMWASDRILPPMTIRQVSGVIPKMNTKAALKRVSTKRAPKSGYARVESSTDVYTYLCEDRGLEEPVDPVWANIYKDWFRAEEIAARTVAMGVMNDRDGDLISALQNTTTFPLSGTTGLDTSVAWSSAATATPIDDVGVCCKNIRDKTGVPKSQMSVFASAELLEQAWATAQVRGRLLINYATDGIIGAEPDYAALAKAFGVKEVFALESRVNTAAPGATASMSPQGGTTYVHVAVLAPMGAGDSMVLTPHLGRTLVFPEGITGTHISGAPAAGPVGASEYLEMLQYPEGIQQIILGRFMTDEAIWNTDCHNLMKVD